MGYFHDTLLKEHEWYNNWHKRVDANLIHWLTFIGAIALTWILISNNVSDFLFQMEHNQFVIQTPKSQSVISLLPQSYSAQVGEVFVSDIFLNTNTIPITAAYVYDLHYDPTILKVIDDQPNQEGVQILSGSLFPNTVINTVDETAGTIQFGQFANASTSFTGKGILATVHFKALRPGSSYLKFDFSKGSTLDASIIGAVHNRNRLTNVVDAVYSVVQQH